MPHRHGHGVVGAARREDGHRLRLLPVGDRGSDVDSAARAGASATTTFVEGELYDAVDVLGESRFDLVYTGVGALCWLPDIQQWARVVAALLRPGGRLHIREGHPIVWTLSDPRPDGELVIEYPYFEAGGATRFEEADHLRG